MITAVHRYHDKPCGRVAFFYDEVGAPENVVEAHRITMPDGSKPAEGSTMQCGSCGAEIPIKALDLLPGEWDVRVAK